VIVLAAALAALAAAPAGAAPRGALAAPAATAAAAPAALLIEIEAGPTIGMDRLLRGGKIAASVGAEAGGIAAALRASLSFDASLGSFFVQAGLVLGLGGRTRLELGGQGSLGEPALSAAGGSWALEPAPWPNAFALSMSLGGGPGSTGTEGRRGPRLEAAAELSYVAYRVAGAAPAAAPGAAAPGATAPGAGALPETAGLAGFSAGFRAFLGARLGWRLRPRPSAAAP